MPAKAKTIADAFGPEVADELARWAIDALCSGHLPAKQNASAYAAKVPWSVVHEGRAILERAGIDWRGLHASQAEHVRETALRMDAFRRWRLGGRLSTLDLRAAAQRAQQLGDASAERQIDGELQVREAHEGTS